MELSLEDDTRKYQIKSYEPGKLLVNDKIYSSSLLISKNSLEKWAPQAVNTIKKEVLLPIIAKKPEIFLLGTGNEQQFLSPELLGLFYEHYIGIEVMTTPSACRTLAVLLSEERDVIAGLIV